MMKSLPAEPLQVASLPYRRDESGRLEVMLLTSRETGRWIIPKGWPMKGKTLPQSAEQEALEEAGIKGRIADKPLGRYTYWKRKAGHFALYHVDVYGFEVRKQLDAWPEKHERQTRWFDIGSAADLVAEPALSDIIRRLPTLL